MTGVLTENTVACNVIPVEKTNKLITVIGLIIFSFNLVSFKPMHSGINQTGIDWSGKFMVKHDQKWPVMLRFFIISLCVSD